MSRHENTPEKIIKLERNLEALTRTVEALREELALFSAQRVADRIDRGEELLIPAEVTRRVFVDDVHPLKAFREWRGLTQQQLADKAGTAKNYISQIETGRRQPGGKLLHKLARALEVPADLLLDDAGDASAEPAPASKFIRPAPSCR